MREGTLLRMKPTKVCGLPRMKQTNFFHFRRYQAFRRLGMKPADALASARESILLYPSGPAFAAALVRLEQDLTLWALGDET